MSNEFNVLKASIEQICSRLTEIELVLSVFKDDICEIREELRLDTKEKKQD